MHIFIDESGTFSLTEKSASVSAVGSLVFPSQSMVGLTKLYGRLRSKLPKHKGEVKGRLLSEAQVAEVVEIARKLGGVFEVVLIDLGMHTEEELEVHRAGQADAITKLLTPQHQPTLVEGVWDLRRRLEAMPLQLYVQAVAMQQLVYHTVNNAQTYFAFRSPIELGAYHWTIDAKGDAGVPVAWELWWQQAVLPMLESNTFRRPFMMVEGGNYSALDRFIMEPSEYKRQFVVPTSREEFFDLRMLLMEDLRFSAEPEFGLEMVDIFVNTLRRSLAGNFQRGGWAALPQLMIHRNQHCVQFISLTQGDVSGKGLPYANVLRDFRQGGRFMLPQKRR